MINKRTKYVLLFCGCFLLIAATLFVDPSLQAAMKTFFLPSKMQEAVAPISHGELLIHGKSLKVEIVSTPEMVHRGLSGRERLKDDEGMLFVFSVADDYTFWMKDMRFPLDIIWLRDGRVVDIAYDLQPPNSPLNWPETFHPKAEADMVLELVAGGAKAYGLTIASEIGIEQTRR